tara:strand:+ start:201 stop:563 length:363 start_codon:yes stop_codon:yes gene_type:complete
MNEDTKYLPIGKVAQILKLINPITGKPNTHTIRFWEKNFKQIKPKIFSGNRRSYDEKSIVVLKKIKYLLKDQGMTIKGVKKIMKDGDSDLDLRFNNYINTQKKLKLKVRKISKLVKQLKK